MQLKLEINFFSFVHLSLWLVDSNNYLPLNVFPGNFLVLTSIKSVYNCM